MQKMPGSASLALDSEAFSDLFALFCRRKSHSDAYPYRLVMTEV